MVAKVFAILVLVVAISIAMEDGVEDDVEVGRRGGRRFLSGRFGRLRFGRGRHANRAGNDEELDLGEEEELSVLDGFVASEKKGGGGGAGKCTPKPGQSPYKKFCDEAKSQSSCTGAGKAAAPYCTWAGGMISMSSYVSELQKAQDKCPNDSLVCPSSAQASSSQAATSSLLTPSTKSARGTPDNDPGRHARCKQVVSGDQLNPGTLDCKPAKRRCWLPNELKLNTRRCNKESKSCPDGIHPNGAFMFDDVEGDGNGYCSSWRGFGVTDGVLSCNKDHSICNKAKLDRDNVNHSPGVIVFMQKRVSCNPEGRCDVFKVGLCVDQKKYIMSPGTYRSETSRWAQHLARAAKNAIRKGMLSSTSQSRSGQCSAKDQKIAQAMIDLF